MRKNNKPKRMRTLLYRYILIDSVVILLPVILILFFYFQHQNKEEVRHFVDNEKILLTQTMNKIEYSMENLAKAADQIGLDKSLSQYQLEKNNYDAIQAVERVRYYHMNLSEFDDIKVCLEGLEKVYGSRGTERFETFVSFSHPVTDETQKQTIQELFYGKNKFGFLAKEYHIQQTSTRYTVITVPIVKMQERAYGTLVGILDVSYFDKNIHESSLDSTTLICNRNGELLYTTNEWNVMPEQMYLLLKEYEFAEDSYEFIMDDIHYHAVVYYSDLTGWYYIRLIEQEALLSMQVKEHSLIVVILAVFAVLLVGMIGVMMALFSYLPIKRLLRLFDGEVEYKDKKNELSWLQERICALQETTISMKQNMHRMELQAAREILVDVLYGGYSLSDDDIETLGRLGIHVGDNEFCILSVTVSEMEEDDDLGILKNLLQYMDIKHLYFITHEPGHCYVMLYSAPKGTAAVKNATAELRERYKNNGFNLHIGIGLMTDSLSGLKDSLIESVVALAEEMDNTSGTLLRLDGEDQKAFWKPGKDELLLHIAIKSGDVEEIRKRLDWIESTFDSIYRVHNKHENRYALYRMMSYLTDFPGIDGAMLQEKMGRLLKYSDVHEFFKVYYEVIQESSSRAEEQEDGIKGHQIQEIIEYIDHNYCRAEMSLSYVANHFGIHDSYFSKVFKKSTGVNFVDYLSEKRLARSCELLRSSQLPIKDIVAEVGYTDVTAFIRKFSKKYGMTPGKYRKQFSNKE